MLVCVLGKYSIFNLVSFDTDMLSSTFNYVRTPDQQVREHFIHFSSKEDPYLALRTISRIPDEVFGIDWEFCNHLWKKLHEIHGIQVHDLEIPLYDDRKRTRRQRRF